MTLKAKLDVGDMALLEVIEDPVWCAEFMRTSRDMSPNKKHWMREPFSYRSYQKDLITDRSEYIVLSGGRAIGKCQPRNARIYTDHGYQAIGDLMLKPCFSVYCVDDEGVIQKKRAVVAYDKHTKVYKVTTRSGYEMYASDNHPIHTPKGYIQIADLTVGDLVSVVTHLPYDNTQSYLRKEELRYLGYMFLERSVRPEAGFVPRFKQIRLEVQKVADLLNLTYAEDQFGKVYLRRKIGNGKSPVLVLLEQLEMRGLYTKGDPAKLPRNLSKIVRSECNENTQVFLEALIAQHADLKKDKVTIDAFHVNPARQLQELFLRHGIEMSFDQKGVLTTIDERAAYRIYTQFTIPGVSVANLSPPPPSNDYHESFRYEPITSIELHGENKQVYAVYVYDHHNYITGNILTHNSLTLEDKIITSIINQDKEFPDETKEMLLTTANQAQIEPVLSRIITRVTTSHILKESIGNRINKSAGTMEFRFGDRQFIMRARIAGGSKEDNVVGLHLPKIIVDEAQLYPISAFTQLLPALNALIARAAS